MTALGDAICRRFYTFVSIPHRTAAAFLCGLLVSSWFTYLASALFGETSSPMLWGNLLFFASAGLAVYLLNQPPSRDKQPDPPSGESFGFQRWDWVFFAAFFVVAYALMFGTFAMTEGKVQIAHHQWSDFGSTVSIMQSFANGHNFPTEYPHFSGDRIRYHFLFYFAAGNLEYLGFNPAFANNILSIFSLLSMLVLVMTLGAVLFRSRTVGRIGAALFFFHGTLSFIPYLYKQGSLSNAVDAVLKMRDFVPSGFDYRGELWGVWSQVVFINQRHFTSSIAVLLLILIFLIMKYRTVEPGTNEDVGTDEPEQPANPPLERPEIEDGDQVEIAAEPVPEGDSGADENTAGQAEETQSAPWHTALLAGAPFIFSGILLGMLPLWNSAVFVAAFAVLALLFLLFPFRLQMVMLAAATAAVALPQIYFLKSGARAAGYSFFYWGYTLTEPTLYNAVYYLGWTFGVKWLLIAIALAVGTFFRARFFIAVSSLIAVAFLFQFSEEILANHKFLNIWLVIANVFTAAGLVALWRAKDRIFAIPAKLLALLLAAMIFVGGFIDLFPIRNSFWMELTYTDDELVQWIEKNTDAKALFLSQRFVNHQILLAGRQLFYGHPYYAWSAGYPVGERDAVYKKMFESRDAAEVFRLLEENNIDYVAIDNAIRKGDFVKNHNETLYDAYFPLVYDANGKYDGMKIFKVPETLGPPKPGSVLPQAPPVAPVSNAFTGGEGEGGGQFAKPRGLAVDAKGNIYVADTGNARIQKFAPDGTWILSFGKKGTNDGELREPNGVAVDTAGNIFVTDAGNGTLVKFGPDGSFIRQWKGPDPGFYGPRDIAFGPNKQLYIVDQGRTRIVKFDPATEAFTAWGSHGTGEGQFHESTGITVGGGFVFVMDNANNRVQVFDLDGSFVRQWEVPMWLKYPWHYPDAVYDEVAKLLYVTNGLRDEILVYDLDGNMQPSPFAIEKGDKPYNPASMTVTKTEKGGRKLLVLNNARPNISSFELKAK